MRNNKAFRLVGLVYAIIILSIGIPIDFVSAHEYSDSLSGDMESFTQDVTVPGWRDMR